MRLRVFVKGVVSPASGPIIPIMVLQEIDGDRCLFVFIGLAEAEYIIDMLDGIDSKRPLTQDLFFNTLVALGVRIKFVVINDSQEDTYYAELVLDDQGTTEIVDARPSDAVALALKANAPIYVEKELFDTYAQIPDVSEEDDIENEPTHHEEIPSIYRDFLKDLSGLDDLDNPRSP